MSTFKAVILKGDVHVKRDGTSNVKIRITHNRKVDYIPTDIYVGKKNMDNSSGIVTSGPNKDIINLRITGILFDYQSKDIKLGDKRNLMTVKEIKEYLLSKSDAWEIDFFEFCAIYMKTVTVPGTLGNYAFIVTRLKSFTGDKLPVNEITVDFLLRFERWLRSQNVKNGINNYMRTFRSLFNKCRDHYNNEDLGILPVPHYPFRKYKIPKVELHSRDHYLTIQELQKLISYVPVNEGEQFAKDMFLLMFYLIGIESKDLFFCKKPKKGRVVYQRFKTGRMFSIKIEPEAQEIINRYKDSALLLNVSHRFELHQSFYRTINNYLSGDHSHNITGIFQKLDIYSDVTTKWSRHTWATIARNDCSINKDDVALCLGHQDIDNRVTDMYIKYDYSIIDNSNRKVLDKILPS